MNRLERLYAVNETLRRSAPHPLSASRLAEQFEVSRRTIERDLAALRAAGVPLYSKAGRDGGQIELQRPGSVVLTLSPSEVVALLIALRVGGEDMPFAEAGSTAAQRLVDCLPAATQISVEELRSRVRTASSELAPIPARTRRALQQAVKESVVVNIDYTDEHNTRTSRPVEAVGFYKSSDAWYLVGWCRLRSAGRIFRLDRVRSARVTKQTFPTRDMDETLGWIPHEVELP